MAILIAINIHSKFQSVFKSPLNDAEKNYPTSVYYMDVMSEYERMGDFMIIFLYLQK